MQWYLLSLFYIDLIYQQNIATIPSEAEMMRNLAVNEGIPNERIILEDQAMNTIENATNSKEIAELQGITSIVSSQLL